MTIDQIKTAADTNIRTKTAANSVTRDEVADLFDNLADEQLARGVAFPNNTTALSALSGANYKYAMVPNKGTFEYLSSGTANGSTIYAAAGGGVYVRKSASPTIINVTYSELVTLINSSQLFPSQKYKITDFATTHYIVDGNGIQYTNWIITGNVESIIVVAISENKIDKNVISTIYPNDIIHYSLDETKWLKDYSFSDQSGTPSIIPNFKGVIYYRHDTILDNYCGWDFRNVKFRRWKTPSWMNAAPHSTGNNYLAHRSGLSDIPDINDYVDYYTFHNYQEHRGIHCHIDHDNSDIYFNNATILSNNIFLNYALRVEIKTGSITSSYIGIQDSCIQNDSVDNVIVGLDKCNFRPSGTFGYTMLNVTSIHKISGKFYNFKNVNVMCDLSSLDLLNATLLNNSTSKTLFKNSSSVIRLSYYNASDVLTIANPTD